MVLCDHQHVDEVAIVEVLLLDHDESMGDLAVLGEEDRRRRALVVRLMWIDRAG
jgi:hypothetical protein